MGIVNESVHRLTQDDVFALNNAMHKIQQALAEVKAIEVRKLPATHLQSKSDCAIRLLSDSKGFLLAARNCIENSIYANSRYDIAPREVGVVEFHVHYKPEMPLYEFFTGKPVPKNYRRKNHRRK